MTIVGTSFGFQHRRFSKSLFRFKSLCGYWTFCLHVTDRSLWHWSKQSSRQSVPKATKGLKGKKCCEPMCPVTAQPPLLDIAVSYDGTWLPWGHSSQVGAGCVTGCVTDLPTEILNRLTCYVKMLSKTWNNRQEHEHSRHRSPVMSSTRITNKNARSQLMERKSYSDDFVS